MAQDKLGAPRTKYRRKRCGKVLTGEGEGSNEEGQRSLLESILVIYLPSLSPHFNSQVTGRPDGMSSSPRRNFGEVDPTTPRHRGLAVDAANSKPDRDIALAPWLRSISVSTHFIVSRTLTRDRRCEEIVPAC
jgi:hypothetical protein